MVLATAKHRAPAWTLESAVATGHCCLVLQSTQQDMQQDLADAVSSAPFDLAMNKLALFKVRGDLYAGAVKMHEETPSVTAELELLVHEKDGDEIWNLTEGDSVEVGPFRVSRAGHRELPCRMHQMPCSFHEAVEAGLVRMRRTGGLSGSLAACTRHPAAASSNGVHGTAETGVCHCSMCCIPLAQFDAAGSCLCCPCCTGCCRASPESLWLRSSGRAPGPPACFDGAFRHSFSSSQLHWWSCFLYLRTHVAPVLCFFSMCCVARGESMLHGKQWVYALPSGHA